MKLLDRKHLCKFYSNEIIRMRAKGEVSGDRALSAYPFLRKITSLIAEKEVKVVAHPYVFPETAVVALYLKYMR